MKLKLCEIVCDVDKIDMTNAIRVLERDAIRHYAYIMHDKDETRAHYHIAIRFYDTQDSKYIASWFGIGENFIEKVKGRWVDMLKYLTHENAAGKHRYSTEEVTSNYDWREDVEKDNKRSSREARKEEIIEKIVSGEIREYNYYEYITAVENDRYKSSIDNAFRYRSDKLKGVDRQMECIYITGESGTGKTTYAKMLAEEKGYSVFISSGSNDVLDGYQGQDCIILDDLRPSCMGLSDLLKMLDNNTASTVKSRYKNKVLECKLIILTSVLSIDTFFNKVFQEENEPLVQLKRRCKTHFRFTRDNMYISVYQPNKKDYSKEICYENPIASKFKQEDMTEDEIVNYIESLTGMRPKVDRPVDGFVPCEQMEIPFLTETLTGMRPKADRPFDDFVPREQMEIPFLTETLKMEKNGKNCLL